MDDDVLLPDGGKAIAAMLADTLGEARTVGQELQIGPIDGDELRQVIDADHAWDDVHLVVRDGERALHQLAHRFRHVLLDLQPDHQAATAALQRAFEEADEVLRLFLHLDVGVADEPESALSAHLVAREEPGDEEAEHVLQHGEAERIGLRLARNLDEALDAARHADERLHRPALFPGELQREREAEIRNERERVRRVDRERRQHREDRVEEVAFEPGPLHLVQSFARR